MNLKRIESGKKTFTNKLANADLELSLNNDRLKYTKSALISALVILHHYDQEAAFDILKQSGIQHKDSFIKDLDYHEWFFLDMNDEKIAHEHSFKRMRGIFGGSNEFLSYLKENN